MEEEIIDQSEDEVLDYTYSIASYGADYPVDSLVKRMENSKIIVPDFQREYVWTEKKASRFIESLLLGLPVPGIFLAKDTESADLFVVDGQQRLKSLQYFYEGHINDKVFRLTDVQKRFEGKTYTSLESDDRTRLDDSILHATVIKQEEPSNDFSSIYMIFERLNTGGMLLQPQEIRAAIYPGEFAELLKTLNNNANWRVVYGNSSKRLKDQEFILRFLGMLFYRDHYKKPLKGFLNEYMSKNRHLVIQNKEQITEIFEKVIQFIIHTLGEKAFRPKKVMNASIYDSVMVGIGERLLMNDNPPDKTKFISTYTELLNNPEYLKSTTDATSDEIVVENRMSLSIKAFRQI
jgi:hypothetical protein